MERLEETQGRLTERGRLAAVVTLERAIVRMQMVVDRLKLAGYDLTGDLDRLSPGAAEALPRLDQALFDRGQQIARTISLLLAATANAEDIGSLAHDLLAAVADLNRTVTQRLDTILGLGNER